MHRKTLVFALLAAMSGHAFALSNTFSYQGSLQDAGAPANGSYDLQFALQTQAGVPVGTAVLRDDVVVTQGIFTVELDFGSSISSGDFQLQIGVRPGASSGAFTALSPTTKINPTPQAQVAGLAAEAITVSPGAIGATQINPAQVQARVSASCPSGQSIRVVNANGTVTCESSSSGPTGPAGSTGPTGPTGPAGPAGETGATGTIGTPGVAGPQGPAGATGPTGAPGSSDAWGRLGTAGTNPATNFIGTTDAQAFVIRTRNVPSLRIEPSSELFGGVPITTNTIAGSSANFVTPGVRGATIAGGGLPTGDSDPLFGEEAPNAVTDAFGVVGGGYSNRAGDNAGTQTDASFATVAGGRRNAATGISSTVSGGTTNVASGHDSSVGGGQGNNAAAYATHIGGGFQNSAISDYASVAGGDRNTASGTSSIVGGGLFNTASGERSSVLGGFANCAGGLNSFAAGSRAKVRPGAGSGAAGSGCVGIQNALSVSGDIGTFVWSSDQNSNFVSTGAGQFLVNAIGGMAINTNSPTPTAALTVNGSIDMSGSISTSGSVSAGGTVSVGANLSVASTTALNGSLDAGNIAVRSANSLSFGSQTRQMLNLWGPSDFGIGVQAARLYFRTNGAGGFSWFNGGVHNDVTDNAGGGALSMRLSSTGQLQTITGTISTLSDARLKDQVDDYVGAMDRINALRPVTYHYKNAGKAAFQLEGTHLGFIAQEVQQVFPEWVSEGEDGYLMLSMRGFESVAVRALQELSAENESLRAELEALQAQSQTWEERLLVLERAARR